MYSVCARFRPIFSGRRSTLCSIFGRTSHSTVTLILHVKSFHYAGCFRQETRQPQAVTSRKTTVLYFISRSSRHFHSFPRALFIFHFIADDIQETRYCINVPQYHTHLKDLKNHGWTGDLRSEQDACRLIFTATMSYTSTGSAATVGCGER